MSDRDGITDLEPPSTEATSNAFLAFVWLFVMVIQVEPGMFLFFGGILLISALTTRYKAKRAGEFDTGGGIFFYLTVWTINSLFYQHKEEFAYLESTPLLVSQVMIIYLIIIFLAWFLLTEKNNVKDNVFGLHPTISAFLLNLWKLAIIFEILTLLTELNHLSPIADPFFYIIGFFDVFIYYVNQVRINYLDLFLRPKQLLLSVLSGLIEALKWVLLCLILVSVNAIPLEWETWLLIFSALFFGVIGIITDITRLTKASGIFESSVQSKVDGTIEEGRSLLPVVLEEINSISQDDIQNYDQYFTVEEAIEINKKSEKIKFQTGDILIKLPFSPILEERTGMFLAQIDVRKSKKKSRFSSIWNEIKEDIQEGIEKEAEEGDEAAKTFIEKDLSRKFSLNRSISIHRIPLEEWSKIKNVITPIDKEKFVKDRGFENIEEFNEILYEGLQQAVYAQELIRNRIRGVPVPLKDAQVKDIHVKVTNNTIIIPQKLIDNKEIEEGQEVELVLGKDEFLFYVKRHRTT